MKFADFTLWHYTASESTTQKRSKRHFHIERQRAPFGIISTCIYSSKSAESVHLLLLNQSLTLPQAFNYKLVSFCSQVDVPDVILKSC